MSNAIPFFQPASSWLCVGNSGRIRAIGRGLIYDVMLEVQGLLRSRSIRMRADRELELGETLDVEGRHWLIASVAPARSLYLDRRLVAREVVPQA
jgi:hypothetical protein